MSAIPLGPRAYDEQTPSAARAYDYYLGGAHNFAVDRDLAHAARAVLPCVDAVARLNRSFLRRAVRLCLDAGITQFLDLGSGIPTVGNVHQVAQERDPRARVVYVDYEPVAYSHARTMLKDNPNATIIQADIREPDALLGHPETQALLDFSRPIGLLMVGVLLFIPDEHDPAGLVSAYASACRGGGFLAASHISVEQADPVTYGQVEELVALYQQANEHIYVRDRAAFASWFDELVLVEPGVTLLADWRPDEVGPDEQGPARNLGYGAVAILD